MYQNKIFLLLTGGTLSENIPAIEKSLPWIRGVEIRADFLSHLPNTFDLSHFFKYCGLRSLQIIFTIRREADGGLFMKNEEMAFYFYKEFARLMELVESRTVHLDYVDIDEGLQAYSPTMYDEVASLYANFGARTIYSMHDFEGIPNNLVEKMRFATAHGWLPKAACAVKSSRDFLHLIEVADELKDVEKVLLGMGRYGLPSRLIPQRFGSLWSYGSSEPVQTQLGQVSPKEMAETYRFYQINAETRICGIIGNPVMHTKSPIIHNGRYDAEAFNGVYLPFQTDDLNAFNEIAKRLPLFGVSVTIPHKEDVISFLDSKDSGVEAIGACNTLVRIDNPLGTSQSVFAKPRWAGYNTDCVGFMEPLRAALHHKGFDSDKPLAEKKAAMIGAGGAARSILWGLHQLGAEISIFNRTLAKAQVLVEEFSKMGVQCKAYPLHSLTDFSKQFDVVVQCTNAGMGELSYLDPSEGYTFSGKEICFDIVYEPAETLFLERAKAVGCLCIGGAEMLKAQAKGQYELFTQELKS